MVRPATTTLGVDETASSSSKYRCASCRRAEHRWTRHPAPAWPKWHRGSPGREESMDRRGRREQSTSQLWLSPSPSLGSTNRGGEICPHQLRLSAERLRQTDGAHEGYPSHNELAPRSLPPAGAEGPCQANRWRTSRIAVANQSFIFGTQDRRLATTSKHLNL